MNPFIKACLAVLGSIAFVAIILGLAAFTDLNKPDSEYPQQEEPQQAMTAEELAAYEASTAAYYEQVEQQKQKTDEEVEAEYEEQARLERARDY